MLSCTTRVTGRAAATCPGRRPVPAWRQDDAVERRRSPAMAASPCGWRPFADDHAISGNAAASCPCAWASWLFGAGDVDQGDGGDGGCAPARHRDDVVRASGSRRGGWRLREMAERIQAAGAARNARQPGDRRSRSGRRRDTCRSRTASPNGIEAYCRRSHDLGRHGTRVFRLRTGRFLTDRGCRVPMHNGKAMTCSRRVSWTAQSSTGDDGVRAPARRRVELPGASGSERCNWRLRVAERIEATVRTGRARRPTQPERRRRDTCRSRTGPGMAPGRCGRAAAKPREDRESVRTEAVCGGSHDLRECGCWRHRSGRRRRWRMRASATPRRRGPCERPRARRPAQPERAPPWHVPGRRPARRGKTMRSSGGEAARGPQGRTGRGVLRMISRSPRARRPGHLHRDQPLRDGPRLPRAHVHWQDDDLLSERAMAGAAVDGDDGGRASARRRVEVRCNWRLRGGRENRGHGRGAQRAPARRRAKPEPSPVPNPFCTRKSGPRRLPHVGAATRPVRR